MLASTPSPPYYALIFTSTMSDNELGYNDMANKMIELVSKQDGFLGIESARNELGITVSYWRDLESIKKWKENYEHSIAQVLGKSDWYSSFKTRIAKVEREYSFEQ